MSSQAATQAIQYVSDAEGKPVGVLVPIELWREIESERETAYLLRDEAMKRRLLEAKSRDEGITLEDVRAKQGRGLLDLLGAAPGAYGTPAQIDAQIRQLRDEWDDDLPG